MLRRHGALGPDAAPHSAEIGAADIAAGLRAIHRRSSPQGYGPPIRPVAGADWRIASRVDSCRATHGGEYREAAVPRKNCQIHGLVAPPNRALIQAGFELRTEALLPRNALAPRTGIVAANGNAHHGYHHSLRISVAAAFLEVLPQSIRVPAERRAQVGREPRNISRVERECCPGYLKTTLLCETIVDSFSAMAPQPGCQ